MGESREIISEGVEERPKRYFKKALEVGVAVVVILIVIGAFGWYTQTSPAKPVFVQGSGQITKHYLYSQGVLVGVQCYTHIRNEGKSGDVTVQFTVTRVKDGEHLFIYVKIFHFKERANATVIATVAVTEYEFSQYGDLEYAFEMWASKPGDKERLPEMINIEVTE